VTTHLPAGPVDAPACALGESPRWAGGAWWWVDADRGTVWTAGAALTAGGDAGVRAVLRTPGRVSLVHPAERGEVVVACGTDLRVLDPRTGGTRPWARVDLPPRWVLNDGTADDAGRLWVGSVHPSGAPAAAGCTSWRRPAPSGTSPGAAPCPTAWRGGRPARCCTPTPSTGWCGSTPSTRRPAR
jgi:sugar lactone lactonase YvrE